MNKRLGSEGYPKQCVKAQTNLERNIQGCSGIVSRMECGLQAEHCAEGKVTESLRTGVREERGARLGEGSDTLQGRTDDNSEQLSAKFRTAEPFQ